MDGDRNAHFGPVFTSSTGWNPIASPGQCDNFGASLMVCQADFGNASYPIVSESKGLLNATSQFMQYSSGTNVEMLPKFPVFGGGSFSEISSSYCLPVCTQNSVQSDEIPQTSEEKSLVASPNGKRKRVSDNLPPPLNPTMRDPPSDVKETGEKRQKIEENEGSDQPTRDAKGVSQGGEATKGYIHVRARRGQATNSHSLAERVRREKISERMKLLQELVPGCNKITGKALMLDEIINYVQSLQQQVEFLSMKLATVNPEVNVDIEQLLSKDILQSRGGFHPGTISAHLCTPAFHQPVISNTASPYHSVPQGMWDGELQTLLHMGFDSNPTLNLAPNGS